jgi:hypothetical protein
MLFTIRSFAAAFAEPSEFSSAVFDTFFAMFRHTLANARRFSFHVSYGERRSFRRPPFSSPSRCQPDAAGYDGYAISMPLIAATMSQRLQPPCRLPLIFAFRLFCQLIIDSMICRLRYFAIAFRCLAAFSH